MGVVPRIKIRGDRVVVESAAGRREYSIVEFEEMYYLERERVLDKTVVTVGAPLFCNVYGGVFACSAVSARIRKCGHMPQTCMRRLAPIAHSHPYYVSLLPLSRFIVYGDANAVYKARNAGELPFWVLDAAERSGGADFAAWRFEVKFVDNEEGEEDAAMVVLYTSQGRLYRLAGNPRAYTETLADEFARELRERLRAVYGGDADFAVSRLLRH